MFCSFVPVRPPEPSDSCWLSFFITVLGSFTLELLSRHLSVPFWIFKVWFVFLLFSYQCPINHNPRRIVLCFPLGSA
jgi:hypothetical protein